jgi:ribonuclease HI
MLTFEGYCDAACSGNPGPGAAAAILVARENGRVVREKELASAVEPLTTNQREELKGAILILEALTRPHVDIAITSDSRYLVDGMTQWLPNWLRRGWRNAKGDEVANQDLWRRLVELTGRHTVSWQWTKGHAGHEYNERCDGLAVAAVAAWKRKRDRTG